MEAAENSRFDYHTTANNIDHHWYACSSTHDRHYAISLIHHPSILCRPQAEMVHRDSPRAAQARSCKNSPDLGQGKSSHKSHLLLSFEAADMSVLLSLHAAGVSAPSMSGCTEGVRATMLSVCAGVWTNLQELWRLAALCVCGEP